MVGAELSLVASRMTNGVNVDPSAGAAAIKPVAAIAKIVAPASDLRARLIILLEKVILFPLITEFSEHSLPLVHACTSLNRVAY